MDTYIVVSWYSDGSGKPEINFATDPESAIALTAYNAGIGKEITVYKVTRQTGLAALVTGQELRSIGENKNAN